MARSSVFSHTNLRPSSAKYFRVFMTDTGTSGGVANMIGNYTGTGLGATFFHVTSTTTLAIGRMLIYARWSGTTLAANYAGISGGLTNGGIAVQIRDPDDSVALDLNAGVNITNNAGWSCEAYEFDLSNFGSGQNFFTASYDFSLDFGREGMLRLKPGQKLGLFMQDDMTSVLAHTCKVMGIKELIT